MKCPNRSIAEDRRVKPESMKLLFFVECGRSWVRAPIR